MKSELKIKKVKETAIDGNTLPALFKNNNFDYIVLFTSMVSGVVVHSNYEPVSVGEYSHIWTPANGDNWEYLGSNVVIKLSNKKLK